MRPSFGAWKGPRPGLDTEAVRRLSEQEELAPLAFHRRGRIRRASVYCSLLCMEPLRLKGAKRPCPAESADPLACRALGTQLSWPLLSRGSAAQRGQSIWRDLGHIGSGGLPRNGSLISPYHRRFNTLPTAGRGPGQILCQYSTDVNLGAIAGSVIRKSAPYRRSLSLSLSLSLSISACCGSGIEAVGKFYTHRPLRN